MWLDFALRVNFCDKICQSSQKFHELLVSSSTLTSSSTSHVFHEEVFVNKILRFKNNS